MHHTGKDRRLRRRVRGEGIPAGHRRPGTTFKHDGHMYVVASDGRAYLH